MERRRVRQLAYNAEHGITPRTIVRPVRDTVGAVYADRDYVDLTGLDVDKGEGDLASRRAEAEKNMREAAREMRFEDAGRWRDEMRRVEALILRAGGDAGAARVPEPPPEPPKASSRARPD